MSYLIYHNNVTDWAKSYDGPPFHALLTDSPYHLTITKRFGKEGSKPAQFGTDGAFARAAAGFMNLDWDGTDDKGKGVAFQPETWEALAGHMYPGAFGMSFASSRGWHRLAVAIEDAGLIIHPSIFGWNYLSGFPKATRVKGDGRFDGHRYGLQAMKPALEPIIVFQKPYTGRPVDCIGATGAGVLNIDGGRIGTSSNSPQVMGSKTTSSTYGQINTEGGKVYEDGRWPANFALTHLSDCGDTCRPDCPVRLLDEQSGERPGGSAKTGLEPSEPHKNVYGKRNRVAFAGYEDDGPASRMFHRSDWSYEIAERLTSAESVYYEPKAGKAEREAGLDKLQSRTRRRVNSGGLENEPRFAPIQAKNHHPCVKPISLTKYLATLLLPPADYDRRILVPFCGVGSEMIGAILAGWNEVVGIEKTIEYLPIAEARLAWWSQWPGWGQTDVDKILAADTDPAAQMAMFGEVAI